ncbi:MAG: aldolase/citrate lyase family protein [Planctomycetaceae bacterium]
MEVDEIVAIDGVDLLFVGPADLSQNLGVTGDLFHEKCIDAIDKVAAACRSMASIGGRSRHRRSIVRCWLRKDVG